MRALTRRLLKRRPLLLVIALFMLALSPADAPSAKSSDGCFWYQTYNYYSDASHTTHVGVRVYYCDGYIGRAGIQTHYSTVDYCDCEEGGK
jgi:hypothetical protein